MSVATATDPFIPNPSSTSTPSPFPVQIATILPTECKKLDVNIYIEYSWKYGGKGCKLPVASPDGNYLAYVSPSQSGDETSTFFVDSVSIIELTTNKSKKVHIVQSKLNYIDILEWSTDGKLLFWEAIWEGAGETFLYDPITDNMITRIRADRATALEWNPSHTAFYATREGGFGSDACVKDFDGYDFESESSFPNLYNTFDIKTANGPLGTPYGINGNLYIEPFGWSMDGKYLWITVTPLYKQGNDVYEYQVGPTQAGVLELSETGVVYIPLAANKSFDYSFEGLPNPKIVSHMYQPRTCP